MIARTPVKQTAYDHLALVIAQARTRAVSRLPTTRQLATDAGVSHATMTAIIGEFKSAGIIAASCSRGIIMCGIDNKPFPASLAEAGNLAWQRLRTRLHRDLANGVFGHNRQLPSRKELSIRYGVAYITLNKALWALTDARVITPYGRTFLIANTLPGPIRNTIILIARGAAAGELAVFTPRVPEHFSALEEACRNRGIRLKVALYYIQQGKARFVIDGTDLYVTTFDTSRVLGFMVWQVSLYEGFTTWLLRWIQQYHRPVALFCEDEKPLLTPDIRVSVPVRIFTTESDFDAGRRVGEFLLAAGHRCVACFLDHTGIPWQTARLEGIRTVFAEAGFTGSVQSEYLFIDASSPLPPDNDTISRSLVLAVADEAKVRAIRCRGDKTHDFGHTFSLFLKQEQRYGLMKPHIRRVLVDPAVTAWVGVNDEIAAECLYFLRAAKVIIPRQVSVIGFDDSFRAASLTLSSYCFNGASAIHRMVEYLLSPGNNVTTEPAKTDGYVHERGTTGPTAVTR